MVKKKSKTNNNSPRVKTSININVKLLARLYDNLENMEDPGYEGECKERAEQFDDNLNAVIEAGLDKFWSARIFNDRINNLEREIIWVIALLRVAGPIDDCRGPIDLIELVINYMKENRKTDAPKWEFLTHLFKSLSERRFHAFNSLTFMNSYSGNGNPYLVSKEAVRFKEEVRNYLDSQYNKT